MKNFSTLNNFLLVLENNKLKIFYSHFLSKKKYKLKIENFKKLKNNYKFIIGYKVEEFSGEYAIIKLKKNKIIVTTDFLSSYSIYYTKNKNFFALSTNVYDLHKLNQKNLKIRNISLLEHYLYGFCHSKNYTIYKNIKIFNSNTINIFKNNKINTKIIRHNKIKKAYNNNLLNLLIKKKAKLLNLKKAFLAITSGQDSNLVAQKLIENKIHFTCGNIGEQNSSDVIFGKKISKKINKKFVYIKENFKKNKKIYNLLLEYSNVTGGIGTSSEIFLLDMVKKIKKNFKFLFLGGAGEIYRNFFKNEKYFYANYLTKENTLKKFLKDDFFIKSKKHLLEFKNKKGKKFNLKNFYLNKRYPRNTNRRILYTKNHIFPINFLADELFYKKYLKLKNNSNFLNENLNFQNLKVNNIDAFNINNFFRLIKPIFIKELLKIKNSNEFQININKTLDIIRKNSLSIHDKWFLFRILNLIIYFNFIRKNTLKNNVRCNDCF